MPTTVTASNGTLYHLFQLAVTSYPEIEDSIEFATIDNELTDAYRSGILCGPAAGTKSWKLTFPTLAGEDVVTLSTTGAKGETVDREQYIRTLFANNKITGTPFVFLDTNSNTYHFVDFVDEELSMKRMRVKIYTTGLEMRERRIAGVTLPSP